MAVALMRRRATAAYVCPNSVKLGLVALRCTTPYSLRRIMCGQYSVAPVCISLPVIYFIRDIYCDLSIYDCVLLATFQSYHVND